MGCDMVVALGRATVEGHTLFGQNSDRSGRHCHLLSRIPGRLYAPDEKVRVQYLEFPQARQTYTVVGCKPAGLWGLRHGVNEHGVGAGCLSHFSKLRCQKPGLLGPDLVRLVLERCRSARQGIDLLAELIEQFGQGAFPGCPQEAEADNAFLVADACEAFVFEAAAEHWVYQEIQEVRAVSNVSTVHQDWNRISRGLAGYAISQGWWQEDGSKLDFAGALVENPIGSESALRRWGRATLLLEQQNGHIDTAFIRRLLSDHYEGTFFEVDPLAPIRAPLTLCQHPTSAAGDATASSMVVQLGQDPKRLSMVWCSFGPPCINVYFPLFLEGELPSPFTRGGEEPTSDSFWWQAYQLGESLRADPEPWVLVRESFARLQALFDQEAAEFAADGAALKNSGDHDALERQASFFMQHCLERYEEVVSSLSRHARQEILHEPATQSARVRGTAPA